MNRALPLIAIALAAAAFAVSLMGRGAPEMPGDVLRSSDLYALRDRVDALEASAANLENRLSAVSSAQGNAAIPAAPAAVSAPSSAGSAADVQALRNQIAELKGQMQKMERSRQNFAPDPQSPEFKSAVETAQREMRNERMRQFRERMEQDRLNAMDEFVSANGISSSDAQELRRVLEEDSAKNQEFFDTMMSGSGMQNREEQRERIKAMRNELNSEVERILEPELAKKFQESVLQQPFRAPPPPVRR